MEDATQALSIGDRPVVLAAILTLRELAADGLGGALDAQVQALVTELLQFARQTAPPTAAEERTRLEREIAPCPECHGVELLVGKPRLEVPSPGDYVVPVAVTMIVCRECGHIRLSADNPAALTKLCGATGDPVFMRVSARGTNRGPFR
jgi:hypothetical protein